ncbi:uncharacterized protein LOC114575367 [Exaiptasia diaphana]|uniref:Uncharacterized protein n=1 Tax=Exaiptasia diaphana TaxID=2652724 RepID=A0A913YN28_EXADI|nr:uncharacterized protein LOC114575367 [Exaiptasia diaphana]
MVMFSIYFPVICLNINIGIRTFEPGHSVIHRVAYVSWMVLNSSILFLISLNGARVNEAAGRLSEVLYNINIRELDEKSELELMLLLSNVNFNYASLTVGGLVTITKEIILTVFGTIVGYLTILIQFK